MLSCGKAPQAKLCKIQPSRSTGSVGQPSWTFHTGTHSCLPLLTPCTRPISEWFTAIADACGVSTHQLKEATGRFSDPQTLSPVPLTTYCLIGWVSFERREILKYCEIPCLRRQKIPCGTYASTMVFGVLEDVSLWHGELLNG